MARAYEQIWLRQMTITDWMVVTRLIRQGEYEKAVEFLVMLDWPGRYAEITVARQAARIGGTKG